MFGFLRIQRRALDDEARADYRAHFCAACHALRQVGGRSASLLTNYDQTVLTMVVASLDDSRRDAPVTRVPCTAVPFRRVDVQPLRPRDRRFLADATLALVGAKLEDDEVDGDRGLARRVAGRVYGKRVRAALARLAADGFPIEQVHALTERQAAAESDESPTALSLSAPTADLLGALFAHAGDRARRDDLRESLTRLGAALGRIVYVIDAFTDRKRDRTRGDFNAIDAIVDARDEDDTPADRLGAIRDVLDREIDAFARALLDLPDGPQRPVLQALVHTLRMRAAGSGATDATRDVPAPRRAAFATQRGDCDCVCCCDADCCSLDECVGGCCDALVYCDCCCWGDERRNARREQRTRRRDERHTRQREKREEKAS